MLERRAVVRHYVSARQYDRETLYVMLDCPNQGAQHEAYPAPEGSEE